MATYTKHLPDGTTVVLTQEQYDAEVAARKAALEASRPKPVIRVSKDALIRALIAAGQYEAFAAARDALPAYARDLWSLEPHFRTDDAVIVQFLPAIETALGLTSAQVTDLLWACRA